MVVHVVVAVAVSWPPGWDWPCSLAILTAFPAAMAGAVIIFAENRDDRGKGGCGMAQATKSMKEFGDKGFLRRLTLATAWGEGLDGFDLGVLSVVLVALSRELGISPV